MPNLESQSIIYGILPCTPENELVNLLIILFKKLVFDGRKNDRCVTLKCIRNHLVLFRNVVKMSLKNNKILV